MLESITIASEATFATTPEVMSGLSRFNYIYGANGAGKTTIFRVIANVSKDGNGDRHHFSSIG